jgi:predicted dehydrogenase
MTPFMNPRLAQTTATESVLRNATAPAPADGRPRPRLTPAAEAIPYSRPSSGAPWAPSPFAARSGTRVAVVGSSGRQGQLYSGVLRQNGFPVFAHVDPVPTRSPLGVPTFPTVGDALKHAAFDFAVVAVPHDTHFAVTSALLAAGKHVFKEKPFVFAAGEEEAYVALARDNRVTLQVASPRSYRPSVRIGGRWLPRIGPPFYFSYAMHFALAEQTAGWRAVRRRSYGGVILDMGYHAVDVIVRLFGQPRSAVAAGAYGYVETRTERLEDAAHLLLSGFPGHDLAGHVSLCRHDVAKRECLEVLGPDGKLVIEPERVRLYSRAGQLICERAFPGSSAAAEVNMILDAVAASADPDPDRTGGELRHHAVVGSIVNRLAADVAKECFPSSKESS